MSLSGTLSRLKELLSEVGEEVEAVLNKVSHREGIN